MKIFSLWIALALARQLGAAPAGALFLVEDPTARNAGLGGATASLAQGIESQRSNPAGLAAIDTFELGLSQHRDSFGWNNSWLGVGAPWGAWSVGGELLVAALEPIPDFDAQGNQIGNLNVASQTLGLGAARSYYQGTLSLGVEARVFGTQIGAISNSGWAIDLGLQAQRGDWSLGVGALNLGQQSAFVNIAPPLPMGARMGLGWMAHQSTVWSLQALLEYDYFPDTLSVSPLKSGIELGLGQHFFISSGIQHSAFEDTLSFGTSFRSKRWQLAYAFLPNAVLGASHLLTLKSLGWFASAASTGPIQIKDSEDLPHLKNWKVELLAGDGHVEQALEGPGALPRELDWKRSGDRDARVRITTNDSFGTRSISVLPLVGAIRPRATQRSGPLVAQAGDGQGGLFVRTQLESSLSGVKAWSLRLLASDGKTLFEFKGQGTLPRELNWNGENSAGEVVRIPDRLRYLFSADVADGGHVECQGETASEIKLRELMVKVAVFDRDRGAVLFAPEPRISVGIKEWTLKVRSADGVILRTLHGVGPLPRELALNVSDMKGSKLDLAQRKGQLAYASYAIDIVRLDGKSQVLIDKMPDGALESAAKSMLVEPQGMQPVKGRQLLFLRRQAFLTQDLALANQASELFSLPADLEVKAWRLETVPAQGPAMTLVGAKGSPPAVATWAGVASGALPSRLILIGADGAESVLDKSKPMREAFTLDEAGLFLRRAHGAWFEQGSDELSSQAAESLDKIADLLRTRPTMQAALQGHCSQEGDNESNARLGQARAQAVFNYLSVKQGIAAKRLKSFSFGSHFLLDESDSELAAQKNRRVDIVLYQ